MTSQAKGKSKRALTVKERRFLALYFSNGMDQSAAYRELDRQLRSESSNPEYRDYVISEETIRPMASKIMRRIRGKAEWEDILASAGLDDMRLAFDMDRLLKAQRSVVSQGKIVGTEDDNMAQAKMVELLAKTRGRDKSALAPADKVEVIHIIPPPKPSELPKENDGPDN